MSNSSQPHGLQPTRLLHPRDSPGKSTGVGCRCLLCQKPLTCPLKKVALVVKNHPANAGQARDAVPSLGREDLWRRARQPAAGFLPGEPHGQRSLAGYSPWGCKESDTTHQAQGDHVDTLDCRRWEALLYRWADTCDADRPTTHKTALPRGIIQREMSVVASLRNPD